MTVAFRAAASGGGATSFSVNVPAGTTNGDYMLAIGAANTTKTITPPAGWTEKINVTGPRFMVWERVASSEPASYTFTTNDTASVTIATFYGAGVLLDLFGTAAVGSDTAPTASSITTTKSGLLVFLGASNNTATGSIWTPPSGMDEAYENSNSSNYAMEIATLTQGVGATGSKAATISAAKPWGAVLVQLYDASATNNLFFGSNF